MNHYRNISDIPLILIGTQGKKNRKTKGSVMNFGIILDAISESNPRVIHEDRARKLANELKRCTYYETCATYGLNVERVFHDGLFEELKSIDSKIFLFSLSKSYSTTLWIFYFNIIIKSFNNSSTTITRIKSNTNVNQFSKRSTIISFTWKYKFNSNSTRIRFFIISL